MNKYVIDTHALIWYLQDSPKLGQGAKAILLDPSANLVLPAIALAEAVWIVEEGRTDIPSAQSLLQTVRRDRRVVVHALQQNVISKTIDMSAIDEMHDRQIVATALHMKEHGHQVSLLTQDAKITQSGLVSVVS